MKVATHIEIGETVMVGCREFVSKGFSMRMFKLGLSLIDQSWHVVTHPHYAQKSLDYICKILDGLYTAEHFSAIQSFKLGVVVHYLSDFCCTPHRGGGVGNALSHIRYENELHHYLLDNKQNIYRELETYFNEIKLGSFPRWKQLDRAVIGRKLVVYQQGEPCFHEDIISSIDLSIMACASIFQRINSRAMVEEEALADREPYRAEA